MVKDFNHQQYCHNYRKYLDSNKSGNIGGGNPMDRINLVKQFLPVGRTIFEIGSGGGDDALLFEKEGYQVIASDYVQEFVEICNEKGLNAILFDAKEDNLPQSFDCIYASAVFVHFSPKEISNFLDRAKNKLTNEKLIFLSVIKGEGHERSARNRGFERDFYYYSTDSLKKIFTERGYEILFLNDEEEKWIQAVIVAS